jgi:hypothetical protein
MGTAYSITSSASASGLSRMVRTERSGAGPSAALHGRLQAPDLGPPSRRETVAVRVLALVLYTALAERELVLRVHERRGGAWAHRVDAT